MSQPCLPVSRRRKRDENRKGNVSCTFDGFDDVQSMDASEYLRRVVEEADQLPQLFVSPTKTDLPKSKRKDEVPIQGSAASLSYLVSDRTAVRSPPTARHAPVAAQRWTDQCLDNFSRSRLYLENCARQGVGGKQTNRVLVPPMKDRPGWHIFCVGIDDARGNAGSYFGDDEDRAEAPDQENSTQNEHIENGSADEEEPWMCNLPKHGYSPTVSLLLQMDQVMTRRVLGHLAHYVKEGWECCSPQRSSWIYALLTRLERPIHRDDAVVLYGLLKKLSHERAAMQLHRRSDIARLNVLIAVIGLYFEQGSRGQLDTTTVNK